MGNPKAVKKRIIAELEALPEKKLREVLDLIAHLKRKPKPQRASPAELDPDGDPILKWLEYIKTVPLSNFPPPLKHGDIDKELYGG